MSNPFPLFLQERYSALLALCRKHSLRYLYAIGSVIRAEDIQADSDVDLGFAFDEDAIPDEKYNANLWAFWHALEALFGRNVDLIHGPSLRNPYLIEEINETKQLVYEQEGQFVTLSLPKSP